MNALNVEQPLLSGAQNFRVKRRRLHLCICFKETLMMIFLIKLLCCCCRCPKSLYLAHVALHLHYVTLLIHSLHPPIIWTTYSVNAHVGAQAAPSCHWVKGGLRPEQVASLSQDNLATGRGCVAFQLWHCFVSSAAQRHTPLWAFL